MIRVGIIGFGEAGYYLTKNYDRDKAVLFAYDTLAYSDNPRGALIVERAKENDVTLTETLEDLFKESEIVLCLTSAGSAVPIAKQVSPFLKEGQYYIDLNSTAPSTKEEVGAALTDAKGNYIEGAVMSAVPAKMTKVPINLCGEGAGEIADKLNQIGMNIKTVAGKIGSASALKMFKSIYSKGMIALITETVFCTEKYGLTEMVLKDLTNVIGQMGYDGFCNYVVTQAAVHNERLSKEMGEVLKTLDELGENSIITQAVQKKFEWMAEEKFASHFVERPKTYDEVVKVKREIEKNA